MSTEIYMLVFASGKVYIGRSKRRAARYREHENAAAKGSSQVVYNAWRKYGPPKKIVLAIVEDDDAPFIEERAIKVFNTMKPFGYNMTPGGIDSPMLVPEIRDDPKLRIKMSEGQRSACARMTPEQLTARAKKAWVTRRANGTDCGWKGYRPKGLTPWNKGIPRLKKTKRKISKTLTGRTDSIETRKRKSESRVAYWSTIPESHPKRHQGPNSGKTFSNRTIRRMSKARSFYWEKVRNGTVVRNCKTSSDGTTAEVRSSRAKKSWVTRRARASAERFESRYY